MSKEFEDFLQNAYLEYARKRGRMTSAAEWAKYLGVSNASLSTWMNGIREPTGKNIHRLSDKLGPRVYDILGQPRLMPDDPDFNLMADLWFNSANDESKKQVIKILEDGQEDYGDKPAIVHGGT